LSANAISPATLLESFLQNKSSAKYHSISQWLLQQGSLLDSPDGLHPRKSKTFSSKNCSVDPSDYQFHQLKRTTKNSFSH
jgi:hypothetical protein